MDAGAVVGADAVLGAGAGAVASAVVDAALGTVVAIRSLAAQQQRSGMRALWEKASCVEGVSRASVEGVSRAIAHAGRGSLWRGVSSINRSKLK